MADVAGRRSGRAHVVECDRDPARPIVGHDGIDSIEDVAYDDRHPVGR